jgi:ferredoxin
MNNFIVKIDQEKCIGSGQCVANAPLIFMQSDEDGLVQLIQKKVDSAYLNEAKTAEDLCPSGAIQIEEF